MESISSIDITGPRVATGAYSSSAPLYGEALLVAAVDKVHLNIYDIPNPALGVASNPPRLPLIHSISAACVHRSVNFVSWYPVDVGMLFTSGPEGTIGVWDTHTASSALVFDRLFERAAAIRMHAFSAACEIHTLIAVAARHPNIVLCDLRTGSKLLRLTGHQVGVRAVHWSPLTDYLLASGGDDARVLLWDIRHTTAPLRELRSDSHRHRAGGVSIRFTDDGQGLFSVGDDRRVYLWDCISGSPAMVHFQRLADESSLAGEGRGISGGRVRREVAFTLFQDHILIPNKNTIGMFDMRNGEVQHMFHAHYGLVTGVASHPNRAELFSYGPDDGLLWWRRLRSSGEGQARELQEEDFWED